MAGNATAYVRPGDWLPTLTPVTDREETKPLVRLDLSMVGRGSSRTCMP